MQKIKNQIVFERNTYRKGFVRVQVNVDTLVTTIKDSSSITDDIILVLDKESVEKIIEILRQIPLEPHTPFTSQADPYFGSIFSIKVYGEVFPERVISEPNKFLFYSTHDLNVPCLSELTAYMREKSLFSYIAF